MPDELSLLPPGEVRLALESLRDALRAAQETGRLQGVAFGRRTALRELLNHPNTQTSQDAGGVHATFTLDHALFKEVMETSDDDDKS